MVSQPFAVSQLPFTPEGLPVYRKATSLGFRPITSGLPPMSVLLPTRRTDRFELFRIQVPVGVEYLVLGNHSFHVAGRRANLLTDALDMRMLAIVRGNMIDLANRFFKIAQRQPALGSFDAHQIGCTQRVVRGS